MAGGTAAHPQCRALLGGLRPPSDPSGSPAATPLRRHHDLDRSPGAPDRTTGTTRRQAETLATSEGWQAWLGHARRFRQHSAHNQLLIRAQRPDATYIAGCQP